MPQVDLMLIATHGSRQDALRELRRLTGRPLGELSVLLQQLPCAIHRDEPDALVPLLANASNALKLEVWANGAPLEMPAFRRTGPLIEERIQVPRGGSGVRFRVDKVTPATSPRHTVPEAEVWANRCDGDPVDQGAHRDFVQSDACLHPLAGAVQLAFDEHRPLRLSPDAVWLTITTGFAQHIDKNADSLRERFVRHQGRKTLVVKWQGSWQQAALDLAESAAQDMGPGMRNVFACSFSSSSEIDRVASEMVFLGAFRHFYDLLIVGICGIPEIELAGNEEDWRSIRQRLDVLAEYGAEAWIAALRPLADEWVRTAQGEPDLAFWKSIYKPEQQYAGDAATGWITQLFPYLEWGSPNPSIGSGGAHTSYCYQPLKLDGLPTGQVRAPVRTDEDFSVDFVAGLSGITQDSTGMLEPVSGWAVVSRPFSRLVDRLLKEHLMRPAQGESFATSLGTPAALLEVLASCDGGILHGGRWALRSRSELEDTHWEKGAAKDGIKLRHCAVIFADLQDGRRVATVPVLTRDRLSSDWWVLLLPASGPPDADAPVLAKGMDTFLEAVLNEGDTPFFEAAGFQPDCLARDIPESF